MCPNEVREWHRLLYESASRFATEPGFTSELAVIDARMLNDYETRRREVATGSSSRREQETDRGWRDIAHSEPGT